MLGGREDKLGWGGESMESVLAPYSAGLWPLRNKNPLVSVSSSVKGGERPDRITAMMGSEGALESAFKTL